MKTRPWLKQFDQFKISDHHVLPINPSLRSRDTNWCSFSVRVTPRRVFSVTRLWSGQDKIFPVTSANSIFLRDGRQLKRTTGTRVYAYYNRCFRLFLRKRNSPSSETAYKTQSGSLALFTVYYRLLLFYLVWPVRRDWRTDNQSKAHISCCTVNCRPIRVRRRERDRSQPSACAETT